MLIMSTETRICQNCKRSFVIEPEDFLFYEKIKVPPPTRCPECRMIRRMLFRNEMNLYKRKSDFSGKVIFSGIAPGKNVKVYDHDEWFSDKWDPMDYGRRYDFSRPFSSNSKTYTTRFRSWQDQCSASSIQITAIMQAISKIAIFCLIQNFRKIVRTAMALLLPKMYMILIL